MKEIFDDESTPTVLRLCADISEKQTVQVSLYVDFIRNIADEIEQLEKKVSKYEHSTVQHRRLRRPWRNRVDILADKKKMNNADIAQRLLDAYEGMRTGSRSDLKDAADEILKLRKKLKEYENNNE
jgi:Mg2+ and Co2+ transporter CorA